MNEIKNLSEQLAIAEGTARCEHEKRVTAERQRDHLLASLKMYVDMNCGCMMCEQAKAAMADAGAFA